MKKTPKRKAATKTRDLEDVLAAGTGRKRLRKELAAVVLAFADAGRSIGDLVGQGALAGNLGAVCGRHGETDEQKEIDLLANTCILDALRSAPVAAFASEELAGPVDLDPAAPLIVAVDPLDGSSNIETNAAVGTIFSVLPVRKNGQGTDQFLQPGSAQLAAGFFVYGPQTALVLTLGAGTQIYTLDRESGRFILTEPSVAVPAKTTEFAINASNYRHWDEIICTYVDDCLRGREGPRAKDFNMRWTGALVAEVYRILVRGGIYLYPGDLREGYRAGRIRLVYEANPIAFLLEQAGGAASTGREPILDIVPDALHQRAPLIVGSRAEVEYVARLHRELHGHGERSPLFARRGLFRL